jgi:hypothetical protein
MKPSLVALLIGAAGTSACGEDSSSDTPAQRALKPGIVAQVEGETLSAAFVQKVANRNDLGLDQARRRAVADTLFSLEARRVFEPEGTVGAVERSVWASALLNALREQAIAAGPATAKELAELRRQRWVEFDRPVSVATVHAVVLVK